MCILRQPNPRSTRQPVKDGSPGTGDQGEQILKGYVSGDKIIAYAKKFGAVGWGEIENPNSYELIRVGDPRDKFHGSQLHRLTISWKATASELKKGIQSEILREDFDIFHPLSTSVKIDRNKAQKLIKELSNKFLW